MSAILGLAMAQSVSANLQFNSESSFFLQGASSGGTILLSINSDGSISASFSGALSFAGPTQWLDRQFFGAGKDFEISGTVSGINFDTNVNALVFGQYVDANSTPPISTAYQSLDTNKTIELGGVNNQYGRLDGSLSIRRKGTGEIITKSFSILSN